jgi:hypothetical protein
MWFFIGLSAAVLYLATGDMLIGSLLPYAWAAWPCLESAFFLRAQDPWSERGNTCFFFYLAAAGCRAALAALVSVVAFAAIEIATGIAPDTKNLVFTLMVLLYGLVFSAVLGLAGMVSAVRGAIRVFVVPNLRRACNGDIAEIGAATAGRRVNYAMFVVLTSMFVPVLVLGGCLAALGVTGKPANAPNSMLESVGLGVLFVGPIAVFPLFLRVGNRIVARTPGECWLELVHTHE